MDYEGTNFVDEALITHEDTSSKHAVKAGAYDHEDPISAALADHGDSQFALRRISSKVSKETQAQLAEARKEVSWKIANEKAREEHPWDDLPEGMPTRDGRMISAADLASGNDSNSIATNSYALQSVRSASKFIKSTEHVRRSGADGLDSADDIDPTAVAALDGALFAHEGERSRPVPSQAEDSPHPHQTSRKAADSRNAGKPMHQGFVTGSHLRVTPKEFYHEMKRFLPSSDGRLISPYEWFQTGGHGYSR